MVALLSLASIASFDSSLSGVSSSAESTSAARLLDGVAALLNQMGDNSSVVLQFPAEVADATLGLRQGVLSVSWSTGSVSEGLPGLTGSFSVPLSGSISFTRLGGVVEATQVG